MAVMGFEFDPKISMGNILVVTGMIIAGVVGYTQLENNVENNAKVDQAQNIQIQEIIEQMELDRAFHVDQRVRLWDRVNAIQVATQEQKERFARMEATLEYTSRQMDRMLEKLEDLQVKK